MRELSLLNVFDPCSVDADRDLVFAFASHRAGMTADTATIVDNESKVWHSQVFPKQVAALNTGEPKGLG